MKSLLLILFVLFSSNLFAKIEDNSFFIEEGFNQEDGYQQFIQKLVTDKGGDFGYTFEHEIPIIDKLHQFSYAIPVLGQGHGSDYLADMTLNYRYQSVNREGLLIADRFGFILPTGNFQRNSGNGVVGFEWVRATSIEISEKIMNHWNIGMRTLPHSKIADTPERMSLNTFTAGSSVIHLTDDSYNLMLEGLLVNSQFMDDDGKRGQEITFILSPGFRFAIDIAWKDAQIVAGLGLPMKISENIIRPGYLFYLSFEPKLNL